MKTVHDVDFLAVQSHFHLLVDTSLKYVVIGVTDTLSVPTVTENPTTKQFIECGRIDRVVGSGETAVFTCPPGVVIGRHLVVMIDSSVGILTVCEITAEGCKFVEVL